jgi:hypothetical protein
VVIDLNNAQEENESIVFLVNVMMLVETFGFLELCLWGFDL